MIPLRCREYALVFTFVAVKREGREERESERKRERERERERGLLRERKKEKDRDRVGYREGAGRDCKKR